MQTYCSIDDVNSFAISAGYVRWKDLQDADKQLAIQQATDDIETLHKQPRENYMLWQIGNEYLKEACIRQAVYRGLNKAEFLSKEKVQIQTKGSMSKGSISVNRNDDANYAPLVEQLVRHVLIEQRIQINVLGRM